MRISPIKYLLLPLFTSIFFSQALGQKKSDLPTDSISNFSNYMKNFKFGALFVTEYRASLTEDVDMSGTHNEEGVSANDGFTLRYVRISGNYQMNDKISASVLVNLADFKNSPQTRVLENAFIKYAVSPYANIIVGQFRPYFGLEDMYPYEVGPSYVWSNQYEAFGTNGWQSFQLGAAVTGSLVKKGIPLHYYVSIVNGNGKNQVTDNDKNKDLTWRLEYEFYRRLKIGINRGVSRYDRQNAHAFGVDMQLDIPFDRKWALYLDAEYKKGSNFINYAASADNDKQLRDYKMGGIYATPKIQYAIGLPRLRALEFSTRYERFEQLLSGKNPRTTVTPYFGIMLADNHAAQIALGMVFDRYKNQVANTKQWNANFFFMQFQMKF